MSVIHATHLLDGNFNNHYIHCITINKAYLIVNLHSHYENGGGENIVPSYIITWNFTRYETEKGGTLN